MRHVLRTHRVALDWLFDRINLDSKIQIRYIDTKHQLADILTKGNFTRDEWNNLLHSFNISHFSSTRCAKKSSLISCPETMAKRMQEQKGEERSVAKSKSTAMALSSHVQASSSTAKKFRLHPKVRGLQNSYRETWSIQQIRKLGKSQKLKKQPPWRSTTPLCDKAFEVTNAKTSVFADSVLCLGSMTDDPIEAWKNKIKWYLESHF